LLKKEIILFVEKLDYSIC